MVVIKVSRLTRLSVLHYACSMYKLISNVIITILQHTLSQKHSCNVIKHFSG